MIQTPAIVVARDPTAGTWQDVSSSAAPFEAFIFFGGIWVDKYIDL